jgi:hypothetical protein
MGVKLNRKVMGRTGPEAFNAMIESFRRFAHDYPGRYDLAMQAPVDLDEFTAATADAGAALAAVVRSYGIEDTSLELQLAAFAALHGVINLEHAGFFPPFIDADRVFDRVLAIVLALFDNAVPREAQAS